MTAPDAPRAACRAGAAALCAALLLSAGAGTAGGAFTPPRLLSGDSRLASDYATEPAVSADGRWAAFAGSQASAGGVYRKDLTSGALELVAGGDAGTPSISADGRWISFTTSADLVADDGSGACASVYVRDMSLPAQAPGAFLLASARDGSGAGLVYDGDCLGGGASAARGALSADGRSVVFTVMSRSDLLGAAGDPSTPPDQVALRQLDSRRTVLVSQTRDSLGGAPVAPADGAALAGGQGRDTGGRPVSRSTATISADGTTVAWMGIDVAAQAPVVAERFPTPPGDAAPDWYAEPLWRRVADGPSAPTRRIVGGEDDPDCPSCAGPLATGYEGVGSNPATPRAGTFTAAIPMVSFAPAFRSAYDQRTPRMSADGRTVALLANQPSPAERAALVQRGGSEAIPPANAFVVDMAPGLTRAQAVRRLTAWAGLDFGAGYEALNAPLTSVAISPDGARVAFTTERTVFPWSPPALVTPQLGQVVAEELYQADLVSGTLALVSVGFDGTAADGESGGPAYAGDSRTLTFWSRAANLVYGAVNGAESSALFAVDEVTSPRTPGVPTVTPLARPRAIAPRWRISATVGRARDGSLLVDVAVPAAGRVAARAVAAVAVRTAARPAGRRAKGRRTRARVRVVARTVASGRAVGRGAGTVRLKLPAARRYRALAATRRGLDATLTVSFAAGGRAALRETLPVRLRVIRATTKSRRGR